MQQRKKGEQLLEETLENLFKHLEKNGMVISEANKKSIKNSITAALENNMPSFEDLQNDNVKKKLLGCITAKLLGNENQFKLLTGLILNEDKKNEKVPDFDLDKKLVMDAKTIKLLLAAVKTDDPDVHKPINEIINTLKPGFTDKKDDNSLAKELDDCLRNLYGGDNPTISGEIQFPILGPIFGNLGGFQNQTAADPNALSLMVKAITHDAGESDPLGLEELAQIAELTDGISPERTHNTPTLKPI